MYFFTIECAICDGAHDVETEDIDHLMALLRAWIESHSCKVQPGRNEVLGWAE